MTPVKNVFSFATATISCLDLIILTQKCVFVLVYPHVQFVHLIFSRIKQTQEEIPLSTKDEISTRIHMFWLLNISMLYIYIYISCELAIIYYTPFISKLYIILLLF